MCGAGKGAETGIDNGRSLCLAQAASLHATCLARAFFDRRSPKAEPRGFQSKKRLYTVSLGHHRFDLGVLASTLFATRNEGSLLRPFVHPCASCSFRRLSCTVSRLRGSVRVFASSLCTSLRAWVSPFHGENVKMRLEHKHHPPPPPPPPLPPRPPPPPPPHASHHPFFCNKAGEAVPCREDNRASRVVVWAGDLPFIQVVCARARRQP